MLAQPLPAGSEPTSPMPTAPHTPAAGASPMSPLQQQQPQSLLQSPSQQQFRRGPSIGAMLSPPRPPPSEGMIRTISLPIGTDGTAASGGGSHTRVRAGSDSPVGYSERELLRERANTGPDDRDAGPVGFAPTLVKHASNASNGSNGAGAGNGNITSSVKAYLQHSRSLPLPTANNHAAAASHSSIIRMSPGGTPTEASSPSPHRHHAVLLPQPPPVPRSHSNGQLGVASLIAAGSSVQPSAAAAQQYVAHGGNGNGNGNGAVTSRPSSLQLSGATPTGTGTATGSTGATASGRQADSPLYSVASAVASWDWDAGLRYSMGEGAGVSACEEAGYVFGRTGGGLMTVLLSAATCLAPRRTACAARRARPASGRPRCCTTSATARDGGTAPPRTGGPSAASYTRCWRRGKRIVYKTLCTYMACCRGPFTVIGGDTADDNAATLQARRSCI